MRANRDLFDLVNRHRRRPPQALDNGLCGHALLYKILDLFQNLTSKYDHGGSTITDLGILRAGNVGQDTGGGVYNVKQAHNGRAIVGDGLLAIGINEQQVAAIGTECALNGVLDSQTGVDVRYDLTLALGGIGACVRLGKVHGLRTG